MRKLGSICRNDETAGHFHACGLCLRLPDPTRAPVTLDFIQLVSIDRKITSGVHIGCMPKRPENGENRPCRHQREYKPKQHDALRPARPPISGQRSRAYITPDQDGNEQEQFSVKAGNQVSGAHGFASSASGNFCGFAQQSGIFSAKYLGTKPYGRIDLGLPEAPVRFAGMAQPLK
jgi:hypothetical protein